MKHLSVSILFSLLLSCSLVPVRAQQTGYFVDDAIRMQQDIGTINSSSSAQLKYQAWRDLKNTFFAYRRGGIPAGTASATASDTLTAMQYKNPFMTVALSALSPPSFVQVSPPLSPPITQLQKGQALATTTQLQFTSTSGPTTKGAALQSINNQMGAPSVATIVDGVAKFLVERAEQELAVFFLKTFKGDLSNPDLKALFPKTTALLFAMGDDIYNFNQYINAITQAFKADLSQLDQDIPSIIPNHQQFFDKDHPDLKWVIQAGSNIIHGLRTGVHPGYILDNLPLPDSTGQNIVNESMAVRQNLRSSIELLQLLSYSLRANPATSNGNFWVTADQLNALTASVWKDGWDATQSPFIIYLGLLLEEFPADKIPFAHFVPAPKVTKQNPNPQNQVSFVRLKDKLVSTNVSIITDINTYKQFIYNIASQASALEKTLDNLGTELADKTKSDSIKVEQICAYFDQVFLFINTMAAVDQLPALQNNGLEADIRAVQSAMTIPQQFIQTVEAINRKNYPQAVTSATMLLKKALPVDSMKINSFAKYATFAANMAAAQTADDAEAAIQAVALPPGSALTKRTTKFSVTINAYLGMFGGVASDKLSTTNPSQVTSTKNCYTRSFGVTAPIGFGINIGKVYMLGAKNPGSLSLFLSAFDIGNLATYYLYNPSQSPPSTSSSSSTTSNSTTTSAVTQPQFQLSQIVSPGAFLAYGIPNSPFSINIGYQSAPSLQVNTTTGETSTLQNQGRLSLSFLIDVPLFNLFVRK